VPVKAVPDTNLFWGDPMLRRPFFELVLQEARRGRFDLVVPELVIMEAVQKFRERSAHAVAAGERGAEERRRLQIPDDASADDLDAWVEGYDRLLRERLVEAGAEIVPLPNVPNSTLADWAVRKRKPFGAKGRGYKDALIWCNVLGVATETEDEVVLVTENTKDFAAAGTKDQFAAELLDDLSDAGLNGQVTMTPGIRAFIYAHLEPSEVVMLEVRQALADEAWRADLEDRAARLIQATQLPFLEDIDLGVELEAESVFVQSFDVSEVEVEAAVSTDDSNAVLGLAARGEALVDVVLFKSDAYALPEESPINITDWDYSDHYAEGDADIQLTLQIECTFDRQTRAIDDLTLIYASRD
jgi:PIN domain